MAVLVVLTTMHLAFGIVARSRSLFYHITLSELEAAGRPMDERS